MKHTMTLHIQTPADTLRRTDGLARSPLQVVDPVSNPEEPFPSPPPPYLLPEYNVGIYNTPFTPKEASRRETPLPVVPGASPPLPRFVSCEVELGHAPGPAPCPFCQTQVTTQVSYRAGTHAWVMCVVFILCGLVLGCCLIPLFVRHFKDAYHSCPRCLRVLHVTKKTCC